jgi:mono/diheme cytochrome c family protein
MPVKASKSRLVIETVVLTIVAIIVIVIAGGLAVIYSGLPNVAATSPHTVLVAWALSTTTDQSAEAASQKVKLPPDFNQMDVFAAYHDYDKMCVMCHGAPGVDTGWVGKGVYPDPPDLHESVKDMKAQEVFWIIKHGIKDTAMPALQPTHSDDDIWRMTAFVKNLPNVTPQEYGSLGQGSAAMGPSPSEATTASASR